MFGRVLAIEHDNRYHSCRDQLGLIGNLEERCREIRECDVKECILDQVKQGWDRNFEGIQGAVYDVFLDGIEETSLGCVKLKYAREEELIK